MTKAKRLQALLREVKKREKKPMVEAWKEIFDVSSITEIYDCLVYVKKEIDAFELEIEEFNLGDNKQFKDTIKTLNFVVEFPNLNAPMQNQGLIKSEHINIVFASFDIYQSLVDASHLILITEDNIPEDELNNFKESIRSTIREISLSGMSEDDKSIFLSVFHDLDKAVSLYKISGINGLLDVIRNNICKIKIISEANGGKGDIGKYERLTKKAIGQIWTWGSKYVKKKAVSILESSVTKYLDENAADWAGLPPPDDDSDETIEDAEIED